MAAHGVVACDVCPGTSDAADRRDESLTNESVDPEWFAARNLNDHGPSIMFRRIEDAEVPRHSKPGELTPFGGLFVPRLAIELNGGASA